MRQTSPQEILAFIDAAKRMPNGPKKELWVRWLVGQYELHCEATVIPSDKKVISDLSTKTDSAINVAESQESQYNKHE
jgi:hypothetical protein